MTMHETPRIHAALNECRSVFGRPLTEDYRKTVIAAYHGDIHAWENARIGQVAPYLSLGLAVIKVGATSALQVPTATLLLEALEYAAAESRAVYEHYRTNQSHHHEGDEQ